MNEGEQLDRFNNAPRLWSVEGAERYETYTARFLEGLRAAAERHREENISIFTHGGILVHSLRLLFPDREPGHSDNTAVTKLSYNGTFHLCYFSDNTHLDDKISTLARQNWWKEQGNRADRNLWFSPYEGEIDWYLGLADDQIPVAPMAVIFFAMLKRKPVGIVQLDPQRDQEKGEGWIDFIGLDPQFRGQGLGTQLIGCAVSFFRKAGRSRLRLELPERYESVAHFLEEEGFFRHGADFEKDICVPCDEMAM